MDKKEVSTAVQQAPTSDSSSPRHGRNSSRCESSERKSEEELDGLYAQTLHGPRMTISQCVFQAHFGRVRTAAEAKEVSEAVYAATEREAALADFVGPFAYRLACGEGGWQQEQNSPRNVDDAPEDVRRRVAAGDEEGYCDNGDVGSGEKLLHLLQKWDVRYRVLMVTRINGGFMMAELMGVRRYKFVIDRAKRLLENTDLVSLRRAVDMDIHPATISSARTSGVHLAGREERDGASDCAAMPRYEHHHRIRRTGGGDGTRCVDGGGADSESPRSDGWDRFIAPLSAMGEPPAFAAYAECLPGGPGVGEGTVLAPPPRNSPDGRSGGQQRLKSSCVGGSLALGSEGGSLPLRTQGRPTLPLAYLSMSSKTVSFPRGHVPSMMGAKGYGKKRGRINHFAAPTPPSGGSSPRGDGGAGNDSYLGDGGESTTTAAATAAPGFNPVTPGWSLPHERDPPLEMVAAATNLCGSIGTWAKRETGGAVAGGGGTINKCCSIHTNAPSRVSTCDTINSPSRVEAIMLGMAGAGVHEALPPPNFTGSDCDCSGSGSRLLKFSSGCDPSVALSFAENLSGVEDDSLPLSGGTSGNKCCAPPLQARRRQQTFLHHPGQSPSGGCFGQRYDGIPEWESLPIHPAAGSGDGGETGAGTLSDGACSSPSLSAVAADTAARRGGPCFSGIEGQVFPSAAEAGGMRVGSFGCGGKNGRGSSTLGGTGGHARSLLLRSPRCGVRDERPSSPASFSPPLSSDSTAGYGMNDDDDGGGCGSTSIGTGGGNITGTGARGTRAGNDGVNNMPPLKTKATRNQNHTQNRDLGLSAVVKESHLLPGRPLVVPPTRQARPRGGCRKRFDSAASWGPQDSMRGLMPGSPDPPPTRGKSALTGWSVDRAIQACTPIKTKRSGTAVRVKKGAR